METTLFEIETIRLSNGNEVSYCPRRGGIITLIKLQGKEILYFDETTFQNLEVSVRGGIPILFPNAGALDNPKFPNLKQHGFARNSSRWTVLKNAGGFHETLLSDEETKKVYPYDFRLSLDGKFGGDDSFIITQVVENLGTEKELSVSFGLHPYFLVSNDEKKNIKFNFAGGKFIEEKISDWANDKFISVDNPRLEDPSAKIEVIIPSLGTLVLDISPQYKKIWVWSLPGKDFVCIEPAMRDVGGLVNDPEIVKPGAIFSASFGLTLEKG